MEWLVNIEGQKDQRIKIRFNPQLELIHFFGEYRVKTEWYVFSTETHAMKIDLEQLQEKMGEVVKDMRNRLKEYQNLAEGFKVIKEIAIIEEDQEQD